MSTHVGSLPDPREQPTLTVPAAGRFVGLSRASAYEAAKRGDLPTIRFGKRLVVPTAALRRLLALDEPRGVA
ncbi:MAG: helix-turn-helix domain-containing protein [Streptosporangiaceae bacterium]